VNQEKIERALDACYDAIVAPETWPDALHALSRSVDAVCAMFYPRNPDRSSPNPLDPDWPLDKVPISHDFGELLAEYARNQWYLNHYRAQRGFPFFDAGRVVVLEHDLATDDERRKLRHYNELYLRFGFPGFAMTGLRVDGRPWVVPMLRATVQGHFTPEDAARLADLAPHLARMIRLSDRFALQHAKAELATLDRLACAAVLVDWKGAVIKVNAKAVTLMGPDLRVCRGTLTAADVKSNRALRSLLEQLRTMGPSGGGGPPGRVFIRRDDHAPLVIEALPAAGLAADVFRCARAVLVITDLDARQAPPEDALRDAFGLTAAEAKLAQRLAGGEALDTVADLLQIGKETARSQLKAVFAKTGTSRQAELVALLARVAR
jgi:DNA-binding CsgD family transcriptional regulator